MPQKSFTFEGKRYFVRRNTMEEAVADSALLKYKLEQGKRNITKNMLVSDWAEEWKTTYKENSVGLSSLATINSIISKWINPNIGSVVLRQVKAVHLQSILNSAKGMSRSHLRKLNYYIKDIFEKAVENDLLHNNPAKKLILPNSVSGTHRALTDGEREVLLHVCETNRYGLWVLVMLYCGLRPGETERIQGRHIDLKSHKLYVDGTKTKAAKRYVPIPQILANRLSDVHIEPFEYLFKNQYGGQINKSIRKRMWISIKKDMHIAMGGKTDYGKLKRVIPPYVVADDLVPYVLRHTYCSDLQTYGVPINIAKEFMGHTSIEMTAKIYLHTSEESFENARSCIDGSLGCGYVANIHTL